MKILFTVQNYYPSISGVPVVVKYLAEGLANKGHQVIVVTRKHPQTCEREVIKKVEVRRFEIKFNKLLGHIGDLKEYVEFVKNYDCDVLINECSQCETTDLILDHLDQVKATKKVFHSHGFSGVLGKLFNFNLDPKHFFGNIYSYLKFKKPTNRAFCLTYPNAFIKGCIGLINAEKKVKIKNKVVIQK